ncbi:MAG: dihydrofolate reductase family protein [Candidatus Komeilibacteria bacterium]|nr:dihydrofolate reductase family protein [Candidatus Komeilibacteria bacterium]
MKITMVMVCSVNGRITKGNNPDVYLWSSKEDKDFFLPLVKKSKLIVMGSKTYEAVRKNLDLSQNKLRIVLTKNPKKYSVQAIPGKLEFTNQTPASLVNRLRKLGHKSILLLGGGVINALFLKAKLVDELQLVVEPLIFGQGQLLVAEANFNTSLMLISHKVLNRQGTLLLKYKTEK